MKKSVIILGSTGSIGVNTLEVISANQDNFSIFALVANSSVENLSSQCKIYKPRYAHVSREEDAKKLSSILRNLSLNTEVLFGRESLNVLVTLQEIDTVVCAISGSAVIVSVVVGVAVRIVWSDLTGLETGTDSPLILDALVSNTRISVPDFADVPANLTPFTK